MKATLLKNIQFFSIIAAALLFGAGYACAADIVVSSTPDTANPLSGDMVNVAIDIDLSATSEVLAQYEIEVRWDPAVLQYQSVTGGTTETFSQIDEIESDTATGKLTISWFDFTGSSGKVNVAKVTFKAIGLVGDKTFVDLTALSLSADDLDPLLSLHTVSSGEVTILGPPALVSPSDLSYIPVSQSFTRAWSAIPDAISYELQESLDATFTTVTDTQTLSATEYTTSYDTARTAGSPVYWRVRALVDGSLGGWSDAWRFYTDLGPLELLAPDDLAYVGEGVQFTYRWSQVPGASEYQLVASAHADFDGVTPTTVTGTTSSATLDGEYIAEAPWYWRIRAMVDSQYGEWSDTRRVVTRAATDYAPPTDVAIDDTPGDNGHAMGLTWTLSTDDALLSHYDIYRSQNPVFSDEPLTAGSFETLDALIEAEVSATILIDSVTRGISEYYDSGVPLNGVDYYYWVQSVADAGASKPAPAGIMVSVDEEPSAFQVRAPYPNPFNSSVAIEYVLQQEAHVRVIVYDILGREIAVLKDGITGPGSHRAVWDGSELGSGVYFYRIVAGEMTSQGKMMYVR